jgi:hypothetical protein
MESPFVEDSGTVTLSRYRKNTSSGTFGVTNMTSPILLNRSSPWSWWIDLTDTLTETDLNAVTDMLAITFDYILPSGESQSVRALNISFTVAPNN